MHKIVVQTGPRAIANAKRNGSRLAIVLFVRVLPSVATPTSSLATAMNDLIEIAEKVIGESKEETGILFCNLSPILVFCSLGVLLLLLKSLEFDAKYKHGNFYCQITQ